MSNDQFTAHQFYTAFKDKDATGMCQLYHEDASFSDPVFGTLQYSDLTSMWQMLVQRGGADLRIDFQVLTETDAEASVNWQANYIFGKDKRPVQNIVQTKMYFQDGKIVKHIDQFDFYKWAKQALGLPGALLGWTPWLQNKTRAKSLEALSKFTSKNTNR